MSLRKSISPSSLARSSVKPAGNGYSGSFYGTAVTPSFGGDGLAYGSTSITAAAANKSFLAPLNLEIDPNIHAARTQEKEQIKSLNNRFASFIDKVRFLEQENKMLETKWDLLNAQTVSRSNIESLFEAYVANLRHQLDVVNNCKAKLDGELRNAHGLMEEYKQKYEDDINKRNGLENHFVVLKKHLDSAYMVKADLEDNVCSLSDEITFLRTIYEEEIRELQSSIKETSVIVQMDNSRKLNMDQIVEEVKAQYEEISGRTREDAKAWYKTKFDQMSQQSGLYSDELRKTKSGVVELNRMIARLQSEIGIVKEQRVSLETQLAEAEGRGQRAMTDAKARIRDVEEALKRLKQDMTGKLREYQELMNVRLALDIEIATYRKLLEGEENRIDLQSVVNIQAVANYSPKAMTGYQTQGSFFSPPKLLIKVTETQDNTRFNSH